MPSIAVSRDNWKSKASERGRLLRNSLRRNDRLMAASSRKDVRIEELEKGYLEVSEALRIERLKGNAVTELRTIVFSVTLILSARISFRAVPRVLRSMAFQGWIPHFSSTINWVCRTGLAALRYEKSPRESWIAIIDMTLDIAFKKALVVLRLPLSIYMSRPGAVSLKDVSCAGIIVRESWKSEDVELALQGLLADEPDLKAILKDGGYDLAKGVRLWKESAERKDVLVIDDISHVASNALKKDFKEKVSFKALTKKLKSTATKIYQSKLAFLAPPKLRAKGRFMGISRLGKWLEKIQQLIGGVGRAKDGSLALELRHLFGGIGNLSYITRELCQRSLILAEVMDLLKTKGLNRSTYREAMLKIATLPPRTASRRRIETWLKRHLQIQCRLGIGQTPLPVCSDIIESLFGSFKAFIARNPKSELNHLVLALPALCGVQSEERIRESLARVSHRDFQKWCGENIIETAMMKRRKLFPPQPRRSSSQKSDHLKYG